MFEEVHQHCEHQLCLELWETGGLVYLLESPWRDSMRKITSRTALQRLLSCAETSLLL